MLPLWMKNYCSLAMRQSLWEPYMQDFQVFMLILELHQQK